MSSDSDKRRHAFVVRVHDPHVAPSAPGHTHVELASFSAEHGDDYTTAWMRHVLGGYFEPLQVRGMFVAQWEAHYRVQLMYPGAKGVFLLVNDSAALMPDRYPINALATVASARGFAIRGNAIVMALD